MDTRNEGLGPRAPALWATVFAIGLGLTGACAEERCKEATGKAARAFVAFESAAEDRRALRARCAEVLRGLADRATRAGQGEEAALDGLGAAAEKVKRERCGEMALLAAGRAVTAKERLSELKPDDLPRLAGDVEEPARRGAETAEAAVRGWAQAIEASTKVRGKLAAGQLSEAISLGKALRPPLAGDPALLRAREESEAARQICSR